MKILFCLVILAGMPALHGMSMEESAEVVALMKIIKFCATKQTVYFGDTIYYPIATLQMHQAGNHFKEDCSVAEEKLHAILTKDRNSANRP